MQTVGAAEQVTQVEIASGISKLDLVVALLRRGWTGGQPDVAFICGAERVFVCSAAPPISYFTCLIRCQELFDKGVVEIPHGAKDLFYQALLRLSGEALQELLRRVALNNVDDAWLKEQVKNVTHPPSLTWAIRRLTRKGMCKCSCHTLRLWSLCCWTELQSNGSVRKLRSSEDRLIKSSSTIAPPPQAASVFMRTALRTTITTVSCGKIAQRMPPGETSSHTF